MFGGKSRYDAIELKPAAAADLSEYKGVWVIVEQREGKVQDVTLELLGAAGPMAKKLDTQVTALLLCDEPGDMPKDLAEHGADVIIVAQHPILQTPLARPSADVIAKLVKAKKPDVVLIGATHTGRDVSSRVAVQIDAGMTADCTELDVDPLNSELLARRPAFGGKMLATIRCDRHRPQMATARPGIFIPNDRNATRKGRVVEEDVSWLSDNTYAAEVIDYFVDDNKVDITKADVLVAGGMGIGGPEGFVKLQELADAMGGEVAATRPVCDKGWLPRGQQIGQTGLSARPKLYIAVGISGAIQHIEGMKESGTVIAINTDPGAQIFQYADIGLVGDWKGHVDALIKEAKARDLAQKKFLVPVKDTLDADRQAAAERAAKASGKPAPPKASAPAAEVPVKQAGGTDVAPAVEAPVKPAAAEAAAKRDEAPAPTTSERGDGDQASEPETPVGELEYSGDPMDAAAVKAWVQANVPEEKKAWVLAADCIVCNGCDAACPTGAAVTTDLARVDRDLCIADGGCFDACPTDAIRPGVEDTQETAGWPAGSRLAGTIGVPE